MKKPTDDRAIVIKVGSDKKALAGRQQRRVKKAGAPGLKRATRWFFTGLSAVYVLAILWTSVTHAGAYGESADKAATASIVSTVPGKNGVALRVVYAPRGGMGRRLVSLAPKDVKAYVQSAARAAGVNPTAAEWIVAHESGHRPQVTGDGGASRGLWQISRIYHPEVSDRCAYDVKCSTQWSLRRILSGNINEWSTWRFRSRWAPNAPL